LGKNVVDLKDFLIDTSAAYDRFCEVIANLDKERLEVTRHTHRSIKENMDVLSTIIRNIGSSL
jgi:hypothetical protein